MPYSVSLVGKMWLAVTAALPLSVFVGCAGPTASYPVGQTASAGASNSVPNDAHTYSFTTIDDPNDSTFNVVTGLNNEDKLTGYYGNGSESHPNKGYVVYKPWASKNFIDENYPLSKSTQIRSVNNTHAIVGFEVPANDKAEDRIFGCINNNDLWAKYKMLNCARTPRRLPN